MVIDDYSLPVQSRFGWHILKLEALEPVKPLSEIRPDITVRIRRSGRNQMNKNELSKKLKLENGFEQDTSLINNIITSVLKTDSLINIPTGAIIFKIGDKEVFDLDFINHLLDPDKSRSYTVNSVWSLYQEFEIDQVMNYEDSLIPIKYPEHQYLINEYREGLMLFEIMESKVWNKAVEDSVGLEKYFATHETDFPSNERAEVFVIESDSIGLLQNAAELGKNVKDMASFKSKMKEELGDQQFALLNIVKRHFEQDDLPIFAGNHWKSASLIPNSNHTKLYWIEKIIPKGFYELDEIKGLAISNYQDTLDKMWIRELRKKNKIRINKKGIKALSTNLE